MAMSVFSNRPAQEIFESMTHSSNDPAWQRPIVAARTMAHSSGKSPNTWKIRQEALPTVDKAHSPKNRRLSGVGLDLLGIIPVALRHGPDGPAGARGRCRPCVASPKRLFL